MKKAATIPPKTVSTTEAARLIGCTTDTIRQWVHRGKLTPAARVGRYMCFYLSDVEYLRSHFSKK